MPETAYLENFLPIDAGEVYPQHLVVVLNALERGDGRAVSPFPVVKVLTGDFAFVMCRTGFFRRLTPF